MLNFSQDPLFIHVDVSNFTFPLPDAFANPRAQFSCDRIHPYHDFLILTIQNIVVSRSRIPSCHGLEAESLVIMILRIYALYNQRRCIIFLFILYIGVVVGLGIVRGLADGCQSVYGT